MNSVLLWCLFMNLFYIFLLKFQPPSPKFQNLPLQTRMNSNITEQKKPTNIQITKDMKFLQHYMFSESYIIPLTSIVSIETENAFSRIIIIIMLLLPFFKFCFKLKKFLAKRLQKHLHILTNSLFI